MYRHPGQARPGPHSVHDARQHAWSLLVFGPGAPAPRQRVHPGMLADVYIAPPVRRRSLIARVVAWFRADAQDGATDLPADGEERISPDTVAGSGPGTDSKRNMDRQAA